MLLAFLEYYRTSLMDRAWGLTNEQLQQQHPPTTLTLARLIGHMAWVESIWFRQRFDDDPMPEVFASLDFDTDPDAEMTLAETWTVDELFAHFDAAVADARLRVDATGSLDQLSKRTDRAGGHWNMRWILIHMIEEYARHVGHADLIRESIDGNTAE